MNWEQLSGFLPLIILLVALYFIMLRPQIKRQKEHQALVKALAVGDEVITNAGILGVIERVDEQMVDLKIAEQTIIKMQKQVIVQVLPKGTVNL